MSTPTRVFLAFVAGSTVGSAYDLGWHIAGVCVWLAGCGLYAVAMFYRTNRG